MNNELCELTPQVNVSSPSLDIKPCSMDVWPLSDLCRDVAFSDVTLRGLARSHSFWSASQTQGDIGAFPGLPRPSRRSDAGHIFEGKKRGEQTSLEVKDLRDPSEKREGENRGRVVEKRDGEGEYERQHREH